MSNCSTTYIFKRMLGGSLLDILETLLVGEWNSDYKINDPKTSITRLSRYKYIKAHAAICELTASSRFAR